MRFVVLRYEVLTALHISIILRSPLNMQVQKQNICLQDSLLLCRRYSYYEKWGGGVMDDKVKDLIQNLLETKEKIEQNAALCEKLQIICSQELEKIKNRFNDKIHNQLYDIETGIDNKIKEMIELERQSANERSIKLEIKRKKIKYRERKYSVYILIVICALLIWGRDLATLFVIFIIFMVPVLIVSNVEKFLNKDKDTPKDIDDKLKRLKDFQSTRINEIKTLSFINDKLDDIGDEPINLLEKQIIELKKTIDTIKQTNINNFEDFKKDYKGEDIPEIKELASKIKDNSKFLELESRVGPEYQTGDILIKFISYLRNERATNLRDVFEIYLAEKRHEAEDEFRDKQLQQFQLQSNYENKVREKGLEIERQTMLALEAQAQSGMEMVEAEQATAQLQAMSVNRNIMPTISEKLGHLEHEINNKKNADKSTLTGVLFGGRYSEYEKVLSESQRKQSTLDKLASEMEKNKVLVEIEKDLEGAIKKINR